MENWPLEDHTETLGAGPADEIIISDHRPGTLLADRYRLIRRAGSGGYATVYLAEDELLRREVALKVLHAHRIEGHGLARMRREVLVAREVDSPRLVKIHDLVVGSDAAFLTMEWVAGESLKERIEREGALDIDEALRIGAEILQGLGALHERGILHRDVKPSNVLLAEDGSVKLVDFGLAWRWEGGDTRITATEAVVGTAEYLAPEQILGERVGIPADLYAFGITLYEMLTGAAAFGNASSFQTILTRLEAGPARPRRAREEIPIWLEQVVLRLLERRPEDRFGSVGEVLAVLEGRSSSWLTPRRRRLAWRGLAAGLAVLLVAALAWGRLEESGPRFSHIARLAQGRGLQAVATDGSRLWSLEDHGGDLQIARLRPGDRPHLVGFVVPLADPRNPELSHRLRILDPETGTERRAVDLPQSGSMFFPDFANEFAPNLRVQDIDGDGGDEILVTYSHMYWPSYTVLYEPRIQRSRTLFAAGGHQKPQDFVDVTGDGREEAIFFGWANRLGYVMGVGAVTIDPWINEAPERIPVHQAHTPDPYLWRHRNTGLIWYELLPVDACQGDQRGCVEADGPGLRVRRSPAADILLTQDGFRRGLGSPLESEERQRQRFRVYELAAEAQLLRDTGSIAPALRSANEAVALAGEVVDPGLEEYAGRVEATQLASGRPEVAQERFLELYERSELPSNVAFDAAQAFHLTGDLQRGVDWYRRVFSTNPADSTGRPRHESLSGLVFALVETGRPETALHELERLGASHLADFPRWQVLEGTVLWLSGRQFTIPSYESRQTDLIRYLVLELQLAGGVASEEVAGRVQDDLDRTSTTSGLLLSLQAEVLRRQGENHEAVSLARQALEVASAKAPQVTHYRTFLPLVASRYAAALEGVGEGEEAKRIRAEFVDEDHPLVKVALGAG